MVFITRRRAAGTDLRRSKTLFLEPFGRSCAMRWALLLACLVVFCRSQILLARSPHIELHKASLSCGGTRFLVRSEFIRSAPVSQVMTARRGSTKTITQVDLRQTRISYPFELGAAKGLASLVAAWQCKKTPMGHVLVLWYYCPLTLREDVPAAFCSSTNEWERYVALDGSLLDRGFSFEDLRYDALRAKLGYHDKPDEPSDEGTFIWFLH